MSGDLGTRVFLESDVKGLQEGPLLPARNYIKSFQVLLNGIEAVIVLTLVIPYTIYYIPYTIDYPLYTL